jgi:hypothetical protein
MLIVRVGSLQFFGRLFISFLSPLWVAILSSGIDSSCFCPSVLSYIYYRWRAVFSICGASACGQVLIPLLYSCGYVFLGNVGAVSCFPLALVLCWCSSLLPVVFQVSVSCIYNVALSRRHWCWVGTAVHCSTANPLSRVAQYKNNELQYTEEKQEHNTEQQRTQNT